MRTWWIELGSWDRRRWLVALAGAVAVGLAVAVPTAVIPTPVFGRAVAVTWWSYPTVTLSAVLGGLLVATYVSATSGSGQAPDAQDTSSRLGLIGGLVTFFAVGCPVCNKLVLIALGASGAMSWFAPIQPVLAAGSVVLMAVAVHTRLRREAVCAAAGSCRADIVEREGARRLGR